MSDFSCEAMTSRKGSVKVRAVLENVPSIIDCAGDSARTAGFDEHAVYQIQLAVDEACANVIEHAYEGMLPGDMEVSCQVDDRHLIIRVRDWGPGFDPDMVPQPDLDAPLEQRPLGGLGWFLIQKCMDGVSYACDPARGNELVLVKHRVHEHAPHEVQVEASLR